MTDAHLVQLAYFGHLAATIIGVVAVFRLTRNPPISKLKIAILVAGCAALAIAGFLASDPPRYFSDFRIAYYPAARAVLGNRLLLRGLAELGVSGFVNIPVVAYLFMPLGLLSMSAAMAIFTLAGLASVAAAWGILVRLAHLDLTARWLLALLFVANGPLLYSLKEGNTSHFILLGMAAGLALLRAGRRLEAGVLLGAAAIIKPPLLLFGLFFLLRRDARGTLGFAGAVGTAVGLSVAAFGWNDNLHWFKLCIVQFSHRWLAAFNVQSIPAFLFRLVVEPEQLRHWTAHYPPTELELPARILFGLLLLIGGFACLKYPGPAPGNESTLSDKRRDLQFLLMLCLAVVSSPLSWSHYYCWLLVPTAFFIGTPGIFSDVRAARWLAWSAILLVTPLARLLIFSRPEWTMAYKDLGVSHILIGGLLWFGLVAYCLIRPPGSLRPAPEAMRATEATVAVCDTT